MKDEIRVIVKRPFEPIGHEERIPNTLEALQKLVGGYIEVIRVPSYIAHHRCLALIVDEEGKIKQRTPNLIAGPNIRWNLVGPVVAVGIDGEDFTDCPISLRDWANMTEGGRL